MLQVDNDTEKEIFEEFKAITEDLNQDEPTLIRFLKARNYSLERADKMLRDSVSWREENSIEEIMNWEVPEFLPAEFPYQITNPDKDGGPIMWLPLGSWKNVRQFLEQGYRERIVRYAYYIIEKGLITIKTNKNGRNQGNCILDLEGLSYYTVSSVEVMKILYDMVKIFETYYPEMCQRIVIINAPWVFHVPFQVVKQIINGRTLSKIRIFGSNRNEWMSHLLEIFPKKSIPVDYCKDENGN